MLRNKDAKMKRRRIILSLMESPRWESSTSSSNSSITSVQTSSDGLWIMDEDKDDDPLYFPLLRLLMAGRRRRRVDNYLEIVESWTDLQFRENFRLERTTTYRLIDEIERSAFISHNSFGMKPISGKVSVLIFLWFMANTEPLRTLASRFDISISSAFRIIRRVLAWILSKRNSVIQWPQGRNECMIKSDGFYRKKCIPNIIGAIDCTHVRIEKPPVNPDNYCNRKKYYSINLQAVVDSEMRFTNVYCGEPGSLHDARVLRRSDLYEAGTEDKEIFFPNDTFLLGDSAYPSLPWLVPPFRDNGRLTPQQKEFNFLHSSTRMAVEKAFGMLKGRFRRIKFFTEYRNVSFITQIVVAACILHNYCINDKDIFDINEGRAVEDPELNDANDIPEAVNRGQRDRRQILFEHLFPDA